MAEAWRSSPLPKNWTHLRRAVFKRDGYRCTFIYGRRLGLPDTPDELDGPYRCTEPCTDADHWRSHDDHDMSSVRSLCSEHHKSVTGTQARESYVVRSVRPQPRHPGLV